MWLIGVEVEQETSATPPKINRGSAPVEVDETTEQFTSVFIVNIFINKSSQQNKDMISVFGIRVENQSGKSVK